MEETATKRPAWLTDQVLAEIRRRYEAGEGVIVILKSLGRDHSGLAVRTLSSLLEASGVRLRTRSEATRAGIAHRRSQAAVEASQITTARWQEMYWASQSGFPSCRDLAKRLGCHASFVVDELRRRGIRVRTAAEQRRVNFREGRMPQVRYPEWLRPHWKADPRRAASMHTPAARRKQKAAIRKHHEEERAARLRVVCLWCAASRMLPSSQAAPFRHCSMRCSNIHRGHRRKYGDDAPRPLILARILDAWKNDRVAHYENVRAFAERLEIGAREPEFIAATEELSNRYARQFNVVAP